MPEHLGMTWFYFRKKVLISLRGRGQLGAHEFRRRNLAGHRRWARGPLAAPGERRAGDRSHGRPSRPRGDLWPRPDPASARPCRADDGRGAGPAGDGLSRPCRGPGAAAELRHRHAAFRQCRAAMGHCRRHRGAATDALVRGEAGDRRLHDHGAVLPRIADYQRCLAFAWIDRVRGADLR